MKMNVIFLKDGANTRMYNRRMDSFVMKINGPYVIWAIFAICNNQQRLLRYRLSYLPWRILENRTHALAIDGYHTRACRPRTR